MPCFRCQRRQTDPVRGASPWKRGVVQGEQVLVCPACQREGSWVHSLDRCSACGSTMLVRALGQTTCRECSVVQDDPTAARRTRGTAADGSLAEEVSAALERLFPS